MKKWSIYGLAVILILSINSNAEAQNIKLLKKTELKHFPSASSLELFQNRLFVIGDDAPQLTVLDKNHRAIDSIQLFQSEEKRISKEDKADLESATIIKQNNSNYLVAISSFSTNKRNQILVLSIDNLEQRNKRFLKSFTTQLKDVDVKELNIEGAAFIGDKLVLSNRANNTNTTNHLIITSFDVNKGLTTKGVKKVDIRLPATKKVVGISGLAYVKGKDILIFTASTEETENAYTDGAIGESYLGYITNITKKLDSDVVEPNFFKSLSPFLGTERPQKIESVAVEKVRGKNTVIHLAADNDDGESTLFKLKCRL